MQNETAPEETTTGRERMRGHVVQVAARLLAGGGRDAVSTRAVATAAGTQAPTIYRLFGDKDGLLAAVLEHGFAAYLADKPPLDPSADPIADLRAGWDLHVGFGLANAELFRLMHSAQPGKRPVAAEAGLAILRTRIRNIAAAGRLRVDEELATEMVQAAGSGTVMALLAVPEDQRDPRLSGAMFNALVAAITTPPEAATSGGATAETATSDRAATDAGAQQAVGQSAADRVSTAANALRAHLPDLTMLTNGERQVLAEWLARITH